MNDRAEVALSVVVIGRNEGPRLTRCLESVVAMRVPEGGFEVIYVDSDSGDDSLDRAARLGVRTIAIKPVRPAAAAGRNAGWREARGDLVLFLDGDTILDPEFVSRALPLFADPTVAGVSGDRFEIRPRDSVYNRVLDLDWRGQPGEVEYCGGDALVRRRALEDVAGFDETLIAGEEPDMWRRMRERGWKAWRIDAPMTGHDLAMTRWSQYWKRATRTGHAYAEVSERYRDTALPLWRAVTVRNRIHALGLLGLTLAALAATLLLRSALPVVLLLALVLALSARTGARQRWRGGTAATRLLYGIHSHLQQVPIFIGQLGFYLGRRRGRQRGLIEYK